jgi:hypothetical protein
MPDYDKLLQASLPEALDAAIASINFAYSSPEQLVEARLIDFETLNYCAFAYFNREDIFYLNSCGCRLLDPYSSPIEPRQPIPHPRFRLESSFASTSDDRDVVESCRPKHHVKELVTLSWGKSWLRGSKYPIRSKKGVPLAILFAGREMLGSEQIRRASAQFLNFHFQFRAN